MYVGSHIGQRIPESNLKVFGRRVSLVGKNKVKVLQKNNNAEIINRSSNKVERVQVS